MERLSFFLFYLGVYRHNDTSGQRERPRHSLIDSGDVFLARSLVLQVTRVTCELSHSYVVHKHVVYAQALATVKGVS